MPVSATTPGRPSTGASVLMRVAFRLANNVGTRNHDYFAAQWLAYALPCRRFPPRSRPTHGSGPGWVANPSPKWTCTIYSLPVSRRTRKYQSRNRDKTWDFRDKLMLLLDGQRTGWLQSVCGLGCQR